MQRPDHATGVARPARVGTVRATAFAVAIVTALGGGAVLIGESGPATAQLAPNAGAQALTPETFTTLAEAVTPAVVAVRIEGAARGRRGRDFEDMIPRDHPFRDFFDRFFENPDGFEFRRRGEGRGDDRERAEPRLAQGSGFLISAEGHVVTNDHVVDGASGITVVDNEGNEFAAELVGQDPRTDLAVLKIEGDGNDFSYVEFAGPEAEARVGEWVMAVGNPFGLGGTVTTGIVSARGRNIGTGPYDDFIQIDAAVNRGNSGGPAFNLSGKVIGVNTAIYSPNGGSVGIGFAIPATIAQRVVDQLVEHGGITRGWIGVSIQNVTPEIAESVGLDGPRGALVSEVFPGDPADEAGIEPGDVVLEVNGQPIETTRDLALTIAEIAPGEAVALRVFRNRAEQEITADIAEMPENPRLAGLRGEEEPEAETEAEPKADFARLAELGLSVEPASAVDGETDARGVVVTDVEADSEARAKGISAGDRILRVAGVQVNTPAELNQALEEARDDGLSSVLVLVRSRNGQRFVTLELTRA